MDQYMVEFPVSILYQTWTETAVSLAAVVWGLRHVGRGAWAILATVGAAGYTVGIGLIALAYTLVWRHMSTQLFLWVNEHYTPLNWVRIVSLALLVVALTFLRRTRRPSPVLEGV